MKRENLKRIILILIVFLGFIFLIRDWYVFFSCHQLTECIHDASYFQYIIKFSITFLAGCLTFIIGRGYISKLDRYLLQIAFIVTICADFSLKILQNKDVSQTHIDKTLLGILLLIIVHTFLILRHSRVSATDKHFPNALLIAESVFLFLVILILVGKLSLSIGLITSYVVFLIASVITAWRAPLNSFFPKKNALMIRWGMILFLLCDIQVGLSYWLNQENSSMLNTMSHIANNFVWFFYTPALVLLSLSGFRKTKCLFKRNYFKKLF